MQARPTHLSKRDILVGLLTVTAVKLKLPLHIAAEACEPLFEQPALVARNWYPIIDPAHAQAANTYAGRALRREAITREEYDWVCAVARRAILKPARPESKIAFMRIVENGNGPEAA